MMGSSRRNWLAYAICLVALAILVYQLDAKSLWVDELFWAQAVRQDLSALLQVVARDVHPPLHFLLLGLWVKAMGISDFTLRFPSIAFALLSLPLAYRLGNELLGRRAAAVAMLLMAFSPFLLQYERMACYYSLALFLGILSCVLFWRLLRRAVGAIRAADFASGPPSYLLKLAYPFFSFGVGETLFPWHPVAVLGFGLVLLLGIRGVWSLERQRLLLLVMLLFVPIAFTAFVITEVFPATPFINAASHAIFAAPIFCMALAQGLASFRRPTLQVLLLWGLVLAWGLSLGNYYRGRDFHNPIFVIPAREMAMEVAEQAQPSDVVVSDGDSAFAYYYLKDNPPARHLYSSPSANAVDYIEEQRSPRVWLITLGRDRTREAAPTELIGWLEQRYARIAHWGYAEQDATYQRVKELLLYRPAYRYKAELSLYQREGAP